MSAAQDGFFGRFRGARFASMAPVGDGGVSSSLSVGSERRRARAQISRDGPRLLQFSQLFRDFRAVVDAVASDVLDSDRFQPRVAQRDVEMDVETRLSKLFFGEFCS